MFIYFFKRDSKNQNARVTIVLFFPLGEGGVHFNFQMAFKTSRSATHKSSYR